MVDKNKLKENIIKMYLESENNRCFKCIYYHMRRKTPVFRHGDISRLK